MEALRTYQRSQSKYSMQGWKAATATESGAGEGGVEKNASVRFNLTVEEAQEDGDEANGRRESAKEG